MAGRPKGSTGHQNKAIKDMLESALNDVGGAKYFIQQSKENPAAFMSLISKIIPTQVNNKLSGKIEFTWKE